MTSIIDHKKISFASFQKDASPSKNGARLLHNQEIQT
jgi:hypothetical protein